MADNVAISAGVGTSIATDDVSGNHYQLIKLAYGILDSATLVSTSNGLPVSLLAGAASIGILGANSGVDIGDVTINNASGGSAVNIQDGGNTITVDNGGTFAVQPGAALTGPGNPTVDSYAHIAINLNAGADQVLVSSAANKQIWVYGVVYTLSVAGTVSFQDESDTAITGIMDHAANSGMGVPPSGNFAMPLWKLATDKDLEVDVVTAAIDGWLSYALVSV